VHWRVELPAARPGSWIQTFSASRYLWSKTRKYVDKRRASKRKVWTRFDRKEELQLPVAMKHKRYPQKKAAAMQSIYKFLSLPLTFYRHNTRVDMHGSTAKWCHTRIFEGQWIFEGWALTRRGSKLFLSRARAALPSPKLVSMHGILIIYAGTAEEEERGALQ
jgi:hypothetical protein